MSESIQRIRNFKYNAAALSRVSDIPGTMRSANPEEINENRHQIRQSSIRPVSGPFEPDPSKIPVLPKIIASTKAPLKVELERRIRIFGQQDINKLLAEEGINVDDLADDCSDDMSATRLDLEIFDNHDFETRSWREWLALGKDTRGTPAQAARVRLNRPRDGEDDSIHLGRSLRFEPCLVRGYDESSRRYEIEFPSDKYVTHRFRILLMFKADDPWSFAKRVKWAFDARRQTLAELDYNLFLDCIPVDLLPSMPTDQMNRITTKALSWKRANVYEVGKDSAATKGVTSPALEARKNLIEELNLEYFRALNQCALDHTIRTADQQKTSMVAGLQIPVSVPKIAKQIVMPEEYSFKEVRHRFTFQSFLTVPEVLACVNKVKVECFRVASASLFHISGTTMRPDEFEQLQLSHCETINKLLRETWVNAVRNAIQNSLKDIGKGVHINSQNVIASFVILTLRISQQVGSTWPSTE
jgi:dynein heavy chain